MIYKCKRCGITVSSKCINQRSVFFHEFADGTKVNLEYNFAVSSINAHGLQATKINFFIPLHHEAQYVCEHRELVPHSEGKCLFGCCEKEKGVV